MRLIRQFFKLIWYFSLLIQVLLVVVYFRFYRQVSEPEMPVPPKLDRAIQETVEQLPAQLPRPDIAQKPLLVLPLEGDRQELLTTALRKVIDDEGQYRTVDRSTLDQLLARVGLQDPVVADVEKAIPTGKGRGSRSRHPGTRDRNVDDGNEIPGRFPGPGLPGLGCNSTFQDGTFYEYPAGTRANCCRGNRTVPGYLVPVGAGLFLPVLAHLAGAGYPTGCGP